MRIYSIKHIVAVLAAATLGLGVSACDDDSGSNPDLAGSQDLAVTNDMSINTGDMAMRPAGNGQVTLADIVGTAWTDVVGTETAAPFTHILGGIANFPQYSGGGDFSDFAFAAGTTHGCSASRYDLAGGKLPTVDQDAGPIAITGYDAKLIGLIVGTAVPNPAPVPGTINCGRDALGYYRCIYGSTTTDAGMSVIGSRTESVAFPMLPTASYGALCPTCTCDATGHAGYCEQHPLPAGTGTVVTETITGGAGGYGMSTGMLGGAAPNTIPEAPKLVSIKVGTTAQTDINAVHLDKTMDLVIQWSCDGTATAGGGCSTANIFDLVALQGQTSQGARKAFSQPGLGTNDSKQFGTLTCAEQTSSPTGTMTVKAAAVAAFLGTQTTGSVQLSFARIQSKPQAPAGSKLEVLTAGKGVFGFTNLP